MSKSEEHLGSATGTVRRSERLKKMTEKGAEFQSQVLNKLIENHQATYKQFKLVVREIRNALKGPCSEAALSEMIDQVEALTLKAGELCSEIRRKSSPPHDVIRQQDVLDAVSKDILSLLMTRMVETEDEFDVEAEAARLHLLLNQSYAKSIYSSTVSQGKSTSSKRSQATQNRIEVAAELAAKEEEMKMEVVIESKRSELKFLELEKNVKVLKAKLQMYDDASQLSQNPFSALLETHSGNKPVSPQDFLTQHCPCSSPSSLTSPSLGETFTLPRRLSTSTFVPTSPRSNSPISLSITSASNYLPSSNSVVTSAQQHSFRPNQLCPSTPTQLPPVTFSTQQYSSQPVETSTVLTQMHSVMASSHEQHSFRPVRHIQSCFSAATQEPTASVIISDQQQGDFRPVQPCFSVPTVVPTVTASYRKLPNFQSFDQPGISVLSQRPTVTVPTQQQCNFQPTQPHFSVATQKPTTTVSLSAQQQQNFRPTQPCFSVPTQVPIVTASNQGLPKFQPFNQGYAQTPSPILDSTTVLAQTLQETMSLNRLPVPTPSVFTGDPLQFIEWQASFTTLIDRKEISASQKFHYLKQYLGGEAKEVVEGTFFRTDDNAYTQAWDKLRKRYGQPYVVQRAFRQKISHWPKISPKDYVGFRRFSDFLNSCCDAIPHVPGLNILDDCEENQKILCKLPEWVTSRWNRTVTAVLEETGNYPTFETFTAFLTKEAEIACNPISSQLALRTVEIEPLRERKSNARTLSTSTFKQSEPRTNSPRGQSSTLGQSNPSAGTITHKSAYCHFCKQDHSIHHCEDFLKERLEDRKAFIIKNNLCFGCLRRGHSSKECKRRSTCSTCLRRHPTPLHGDFPSTSDSANKGRPVEDDHQETTAENDIVPSSVSCRTNIGKGGSTSMIVPVWVSTADQPNQEVLVYALLDTQSDTSFISEETVAALSVKRIPVELKLSTMTATDCIVRCDAVKGLQVRGFSSHTYISIPRAYTKDYIPVEKTHIPTSETAEAWQHLKGITSHLQPLQNCDVGLLIGYDTPQALIPRETIVGDNSEPYGIRTDLGWSIVGCVYPCIDKLSRTVHRTSVREVPTVSPREVLKVLESDFTDVEDEILVSQEDIQFIRILENEIRHKDDRHYEMPLPFKSRPCLPNNRKLAEIRLAHLRKKLASNKEFKQHYVAFVEEMLKRGDAELVRDPGVDGENWYLPHHGVYHPKKPKKIRVVFDCSAKFKGSSLNDHLLTGPELTNELIGVLMRFRKHSIGIMCDVEQMFHQFHVSLPDRNYLRFLWWEDGDISQEPQEYRMKVHLFGAASSPGCANYGFRSLAREYKDQYPLASSFVCRNFYVDDGVVSIPSVDKAIRLVKEATELCRKGGLRLHKFISNNRDVLKNIPISECASTVKEIDLSINALPVETALGIQWSLEDDMLALSQPQLQYPATRRGILSAIASLFDPLGLFAPYVLKGKRILQVMCRRGVGWDDPVPQELNLEWEAWKGDQETLYQIRIPRCYHPPDFDVRKVELHHFSDASTKGYGQCSYLRFISLDGGIYCCLVTGKSRVAPTKVTTIPRLELAAAVISVKVSCLLKRELDYEKVEEFFWTDSKAVLGYINNEARRFHTFVANRVQYIRDKTSVNQWGFVPSEHNPADGASRGLTVDELKNSMWLTGPSFLWSKEILEFKSIDVDLTVGDPEVKSTQVLAVNTCISSVVSERLSRFSRWSLAVRAFARLKRLASGLKGEHPTTVAEMLNAERFIIKEVQKTVFAKEIRGLGKKSCNLGKLNPYIDSEGILRVGGRLEASTLPEEIKHPAIIPKNHCLATLIITHFHDKIKHQGRGMTLNEIRAHGFWIIGMSKAVASHIYKCVTCRKGRRPVEEQKMANLPVDRTEDAPPFTFTGMDCFGPFFIKERRKELKCYGLLFTCMTSRAVHIEMLDDMSTDAFINALRCFIALRGRVQVLRSDQGTNFLGARNEFERGMKEVDVARLQSFMADRQCEFVMNTPHSSHAGGVWERQIRTARSILCSLMQEAKGRLDTSSFRTFLYEVMYIINSRPLTTETSSDPLSLEPLTPNHVLTMKSNIAYPPPGNFVKEDVYLRKRWRRVQYLSEQFWSRWRKEYLQNLNKRQKWCTPRRNIKLGDIVLVHDKESPRNKWPLAMIIEVIEGSDGLVRRARVRMGTSKLDGRGKRTSSPSVLERPIQELVLLIGLEDYDTS